MSTPSLRVAFRQQVRAHALAHAQALVVAHGWDAVRMGQVATAVGVSRPTLYKEFGDRRGLGQALVQAEVERFLVGVQAALDGAPDVSAAVLDAVTYALREAGSSPLLHAVLTSTRGDDSGLLPLLTTRSAPLLEAASTVLFSFLTERMPDRSPDDVAQTADALVRLVVSHLVQPAGPYDQTAERLARVARRMLEIPTTPR